MKQVKLCKLFLGLMLLTGSYVAVAEPVESVKTEPEKSERTTSFNALQAYWVFSGIVTNESGEQYSYYFQMQRKNSQFYAIATLINSQTKEVLLFEESNATIAQPEVSNWQVGSAFLQFNPINNSWIFGVKTKNKKGFNFKADMLSQTENTHTIQGLRSGVEFLINQTGRLNGHLQIGDDSGEQFVTAQKAWFKQLWVSKPQGTMHPLTGVLCQFNDGSGFYAVSLQEEDALKGAVAGWRNAQGIAVSMSQFVTVKESKDDIWHISIASPKIQLSLQDALAKENEKHQLIAGLTNGVMPGFCTISKDEIGQPQQTQQEIELGKLNNSRKSSNRGP